ncbi:MAG TPA: TetR/AcrR family transcriptional regulator [Pedomonas sp.]|nr:TetR/AcrR family transcriptional regulator [Pedomonas sp.]
METIKIPRETRADKRRRQVLDAAGACFREEGFHGASMSRIAARAEMSVGHIYRYFDSKEAIIIALVERDCAKFDNWLKRMISAAASIETIIENLRRGIPWLLNRDRAAIFLEMHAEAGRNPKIAVVLAEMDRNLRTLLKELIGRVRSSQAAPLEVTEATIEMVLLMLQGVAARVTINPDMSRGTLEEGFERVARAVLAPETCAR